MNQRIWMKSMAVVVMALSACAAYATDATVAGDTYVSSASPAINYGGLSNLYVGNGGTALIQFDLTSLPAGTTAGQIAKVTLKLYVNRINTSGTISVLPVTSTWNEYTVTYNSIPTLGSTITTFTPTTAQQFVVIDITSQVQSWVTTPSSNYGIALTSTAGNIVLDSKENDETSHVAHLDITVVSPGATGPAGAAATVTVGTTTTGAAGSSASVSNSGTTSAAILSFTIPQGAVGATGATGAKGDTGATGPAGPTGSPVTFKGKWLTSTTYAVGDAVFWNGSSYVALASNIHTDPYTDVNVGGGTIWGVMVQGVSPKGAWITGTTYLPGDAVTENGSSYIALASNIHTDPYTDVNSGGGTIWALLAAKGDSGSPATFMGDWSSGTTYTVGEAVYYNGSSYVELQPNNSAKNTATPPTDIANGYGYWALLAAQGAQGPAGAAGGVTSVSTGTIANNASAGAGTASIGGTAANPVLNVNFPADVQSVSAGTVTSSGSTGTLTIGGTATNPVVNVNFPASSGGSSIYGDGSETANCSVTSNANWTTSPISSELQCSTFTLGASATLHVPSGTVIRSKGTVTISGNLIVDPGGAQGLYLMSGSDGSGSGGIALPVVAQRRILMPGPYGGGNGTYMYHSKISYGGGSLVILSEGALTISGTITANGTTGVYDSTGNESDGGGAGGIIILASGTSITNSGAIDANGGAGAPSNGSNSDAGGGGGGGIIHMLAPSITQGPTSVAGGTVGTGTYNYSVGNSGAGGACGGNGGNSSYPSGVPGAATAGSVGNVFTTTVADPSTLFVP